MEQQTRKVVINSDYGGFELSPKAIARLAELQGKSCHFFVHDSSQEGFRYKLATMNDAETSVFWMAYTVPNPHEYVGGVRHEQWMTLPPEERQAINKRWDEITLDKCPEQRDDPLLVQVVEELGDDASGKLSSLRIVEIPADVEYEIEEYDGREWVAEKHRTWA